MPSSAKNQCYPKELLKQLSIQSAEAVPTIPAANYLTRIKGIPTAPSSLEVYRCQGKGPKYKKIGSRVFYTLPWLDEHAAGIEIKIFDPANSHREDF
ncbi:MAG TPA: hypothetical protein ENJ30_07845 [Desulfobulbaceae bacterium]|nr:hypothetical protein [Desulfobulbaceae bacterium]